MATNNPINNQIGDGQSISNPGLLDQQGASAYLRISPRTLENWRYRGGGPKYIRLSPRAVRYRLSDLEAWVLSCQRNNTSAQGP